MDYRKINKYAKELEKECEMVTGIDERIEDEKETTVVPEPTVEATEKDVVAYLTAMENEEKTSIEAAEKLIKASKKLYAMDGELTDSQKKQLKAYLMGIHRSLTAAFGKDEGEEEEEGLKRQDVVKELNRRFNKEGKLLVKINWKKTNLTPGTKLRDMTLEDLRSLLTCVKG